MNLFMPTHLINEKNCIVNHTKELCSLGTNALIITGAHSSQINGSLNDTKRALELVQIPYTIFDSIEENPSIETVVKAAAVGIENKVDFVIGIGGGSPLDAAKAIALLIANPDKEESILFNTCHVPHLPLACIPTTAGTGSEVTPYSILTIHKEKTKKGISQKIFPNYAFIDASYLKTASQSGLINTAVDTLAHLIESFLNTNSNFYNRIYSEKGLTLWGSIKDNLLDYNILDSTYDTLMNASTLGGMAITHTGTSIPHGLSYTITYELGIPHGKAVGLFLGGFIAYYEGKEDVNQLLSILGFEHINQLKEYLYSLLQLSQLQVPTTLLEHTVQALYKNKAKLKNYPYTMTIEQLKNMAQI